MFREYNGRNIKSAIIINSHGTRKVNRYAYSRCVDDGRALATGGLFPFASFNGTGAPPSDQRPVDDHRIYYITEREFSYKAI